MNTSIVPPQQHPELEEFFQCQADAERIIDNGSSNFLLIMVLLGSRDLDDYEEREKDPTFFTDIDVAINNILSGKKAIQRAQTLVEPQRVPPVIWDLGWTPAESYKEFWDEPMAFVDDTLLFLEVYRDALQWSGSLLCENQARQRALGLHLFHCHQAIYDVVHQKVPAWRVAVRQDILDGTGFLPDENQEIEPKGVLRS